MGSYKPAMCLPSYCFPSRSHPILNDGSLLQGEIPHEIDPFCSLHREPDEEQIVDD